MNRSTRRVLIALSVALLVVINIVAMRWSTAYFFPTERSRLLGYGSQMPTLKGQNLLNDKTIQIATSRTNLILYFSSTHPPGLSIELVKYAEILSQHYGKEGLGISAIVQPGVDELKGLVSHSLLTYDLLLDENHQLGKTLGLSANENGVFLFDRQGICRFSTRGPVSARDLQQLVALEFLGVDPYSHTTLAEQGIEQGKRLGPWSVLNVRSWQQTSLEKISSGQARRFIFFTAECSVCSLPGYLEEFGKFEHAQPIETATRNPAVLIFDYNFSIGDVIEQLKTYNIKSPAYIANEELPAVADMVHGTQLNDETVVSVTINPNGTVLDISPLKSLIPELTDSRAAETKGKVKISPTLEAHYEQVFSDIPLTAYDVTAYREKYILTDFKGNRIFILNDKMHVEREFGRIGSGPGRLFRPGSVDVSNDGTIYVEDGGNERIVKFTSEGSYLGELPLNNYEGLAVGPGNELYLGQPEEGHIITVYSSSGKKLRSFGQLKTFSEMNGPEFADKDKPFKFAINRVRLATDSAGNVYVSFMLTPLLQKYSPNGDLLFEHRLEGPEIELLKAAVQKRKYITSPVEGPADGRIIALDPLIDRTTGDILVPLVDGSVYVADAEGKRVNFLRPHASHSASQTFYPFVAGLGAKGEFLVNPFPPKRWYRLVIPTDSEGKASSRFSKD